MENKFSGDKIRLIGLKCVCNMKNFETYMSPGSMSTRSPKQYYLTRHQNGWLADLGTAKLIKNIEFNAVINIKHKI